VRCCIRSTLQKIAKSAIFCVAKEVPLRMSRRHANICGHNYNKENNMPYISEINRNKLDPCIEQVIQCIKNTQLSNTYNLQDSLGDINYTFSRITAGLMEKPSYSKIAMITGVLENIKQEFYRRVASSYEDQKIVINGDIKEYKSI